MDADAAPLLEEELPRITISNYESLDGPGLEVRETPLIILKGRMKLKNRGIKEAKSSGGNTTALCPLDIDMELIDQAGENVSLWMGTPKKNSSTLDSGFRVQAYFTAVVRLSLGENVLDFRVKHRKGVLVNQLKVYFNPPEQHPSYHVQVLLARCKDDERPSQILDKLLHRVQLGIQLIQAYFHSQIGSQQGCHKSFHLSKDSPKLVRIDISAQKLTEMTTHEVWQHLVKFIRTDDSLWDVNAKYVILFDAAWGCSTESDRGKHPADRKACAAGGLALLPGHFLTSWPDHVQEILSSLDSNVELTDPLFLQFMEDLPNPKTIGRLFAASLGSVAHEIGHIFDLGHIDRGLMGQDYYQMDVFFDPKFFSDDFGNSMLNSTAKTIMFYGRWFNTSTNEESSKEDFYGPALLRGWLMSKNPVTAIEIRNLEEEKVLRDYAIERNPILTQIRLSKGDIPFACEDGRALLFAQDVKGNILKTLVCRDELSQSFTPLCSRTRRLEK